ncbi:phospholipid-transporting ATPase ABCA1-like isoform X3 [Rhodnius prolixus]|uniref:phospholipid-transporting ATPase ABCA1-like isoform X3 n=1 Tax=Rhodnius prolixus TaxID=13249 RepID=UPI003D188335
MGWTLDNLVSKKAFIVDICEMITVMSLCRSRSDEVLRFLVRLFIELLWPLMLFLILMWVRSRGLRKEVHECHFTQKALPSAGFLPFLQSFICTYNNTCYFNENDAAVRTGNLTSSGTMELYHNLKKIFNISNEMDSIRKASQTSTVNAQKLTEIINTLKLENTQQNSINLRQLLKNPDELNAKILENNLNISADSLEQFINYNITNGNFKNGPLSLIYNSSRLEMCNEFHEDESFLNDFCELNNEQLVTLRNLLIDDLENSDTKYQLRYYLQQNLDNYISWKEWNQLIASISSIQKNVVSRGILDYQNLENKMMSINITQFEEATSLILKFMCGNRTNNAIKDFLSDGGQATRFDSLQDQFRNRSIIKYQYDPEVSPDCNELFFTIENDSGLMFLWRIIKPFIVGRILFTPVTPATERIMKRVNESFESMILLKNLLEIWANQTFPLNRDVPSTYMTNLRSIQEFLNSSAGQKFLNPEYSNITMDLNNYLVLLRRTAKNLNMTSTKTPGSEIPEGPMPKQPQPGANPIPEGLGIISQFLECYEQNKIRGYNSTEEAENEAMRLIYFNKLWALVQFESPGWDKLSPLTTYKIRMNTERVDNTEYIQDRLMSIEPRRRPIIDLKYITYGFAYLQDLIDHSIISEQTGRRDLPGIIFQQFPYPCYISDEFIMAISRTFPLFMVLSWSYSCAMIVKSIVYEKEQRLKETMRVMGLGNGIHWIGWFVDSLIPMSVTLVALVLILVYGKVLINSDPFVLYLFLFCYALATIAQAFLISVFFSKANLAAACAGIIFFIFYLPYPFLVRWMAYLTPLHKTLLSLSANVALGVGASYIAFYEEQGVGMQWDNIQRSPIYNDEFNLVSVMYMSIVDFVIYLVLTWYIEAVFPGQYGIPRPWYFPFTLSYWSGKEVTKVFADNESVRENASNVNFEKDPTDLNAGVIVNSLRKVFRNGKVAVNDISIKFYEGQITSFLGHNGAGKTTTISLLTGLFPPTSGTAVINGFDIRTDMNKVRNNLGMCPQHNVLFNRLTVEEHLWFYGMLRGGSSRKAEMIKNEIEEMLVDLGLPHKRDALSSTLSGGMQRKLSVAVAFIGGSRTIILDEPTSGVDPYSRRSIWELLIKYKRGKTVILTTHYMDEADLLGDRIAIIANGKLICCGTSLFLKRTFGFGYHLTIERASYTLNAPSKGQVEGNQKKSPNNSSVEDLTKLIQRSVSSAEFLEHIGNEVLYVLPEKDISRLSALCNSLDVNLSKYKIVSYGISDTSLEEIFIRVAEEGTGVLQDLKVERKRLKYLSFKQIIHRKRETPNTVIAKELISPQKEKFVNMNGANVKYSQIPIVEEKVDQKRSSHKFWRQFFALHTKRFYHTVRNKKGLFSELVLPALFICMSLIVTTILPKLEERPPLELDIWQYSAPRYMFFDNNASKQSASAHSSDDDWAYRYVSNALGHYGIGAKCLKINGERNPECNKLVTFKKGRGPNVPIPRCSCASGGQVCPKNIDDPPPPSYKIVSDDIFYNMTGENVPDWIINTWPKYTMHRLGGYTIAANATVPNLNLSAIMYMKERFGKPTRNIFPNIVNLISMFPNMYTPSTKNNIKVWFNNKGWLSSVAYMNAINNVILRATLDSLNKSQDEISEYGIRTINHPMNFTQKQMNIEIIRQGVVSILHSISIIFALSFVPASFTLYLIEERVSHSKHLLLVSGVNRLIFWIEEFIWDIVAYAVSAFLCILIFVIFNEQSYISPTNLPGVILLFLLYGWSCIPLMYLLSYVFTIPSSAFVGLACANMFIGIVTTVTTFVLGAFEDEELKAVHRIIKEVFLIFPHYCLGSGILDLAQNHLAAASLLNLDIEYKSNIFEWNLLGKPLLCMFVLGNIFFLFNLAIEFGLFTWITHWTKWFFLFLVETIIYRICKKLMNWTVLHSSFNNVIIKKIRRRNFMQNILISVNKFFDQLALKFSSFIIRCSAIKDIDGDEEDDVAAEKERIHRGDLDGDIMVIKDLTKVYKYNQVPSVKRINVGVKEGECFGLLGINGAGKTTTFKMLTGATRVTSGDATIGGYSVVKKLSKVHSILGYCPQFDALDPLLTPREHLILYGRIKNIPSFVLNKRVDITIQQMGLGYYSNKLSGTLSGGNKRKLSAAIALIGSPPLVFLDEPTTGMDPKARRFLWTRIQDLVRNGTSVVLTSHSMEECQALCTRLTIMVNGQFKCIGSSQHLKNKYGAGYRIVIRCKENNITTVKEFMKVAINSSRLIEEHYNQLRYDIPDGKLSDIFRHLEEGKQRNILDDYSLSQTTLEEVFLRFASEQSNEPARTRMYSPVFLNKCLSCCRGNKED